MSDDSIISLGGSEVIDLDTASPAQLRAAAAKLRYMPVDHRIEMIARHSSPPSGPQHNVASLNAQRVDFDYEADAAEMRQKRALAEITRALEEEKIANKKSQVDVRVQLRERAGLLGRLTTAR